MRTILRFMFPSAQLHHVVLSKLFQKIEACITEVLDWMMANFLKLNAEKTKSC